MPPSSLLAFTSLFLAAGAAAASLAGVAPDEAFSVAADGGSALEPTLMTELRQVVGKLGSLRAELLADAGTRDARLRAELAAIEQGVNEQLRDVQQGINELLDVAPTEKVMAKVASCARTSTWHIEPSLCTAFSMSNGNCFPHLDGGALRQFRPHDVGLHEPDAAQRKRRGPTDLVQCAVRVQSA